MDAAVALQRKKTLKFLCIVDFPLSKQGIFFVTLKHKTVIKKMSQSFFFVVASKIGGFANQFLNTALQCCPTIFWRFAHPEAHFFCHFLEFGREWAVFLRKNRMISAAFRMFSISPWSVFCRLRGFFAFPDSFQFVFGFSILYLWTSCGKQCGQ